MYFLCVDLFVTFSFIDVILVKEIKTGNKTNMKGVSGAKIKEGGMIEVDNQILLKLYSLYQKELYLYLYSLCGDRHLAEDLLHETFLKALLALPDGHGNMRAWLYMVARNLFYNQQKKKSREILMDEQIYPLEEKNRERSA